jgi:hypothetical protein
MGSPVPSATGDITNDRTSFAGRQTLCHRLLPISYTT